MMHVVLNLLAGLGFCLLLVSLHEYGHLWTGRILGMPPHAIRVNLNGRPPHIALYDGLRWLAPDDPGYAGTFNRHCPGVGRAWGFVAGGTSVETIVSFVVIASLVGMGLGPVAVVLAAATTILFIGYVVLDVGVSCWRRAAYGDFAVLWTISPARTVTWTIAVALLKIGTLLWLA